MPRPQRAPEPVERRVVARPEQQLPAVLTTDAGERRRGGSQHVYRLAARQQEPCGRGKPLGGAADSGLGVALEADGEEARERGKVELLAALQFGGGKARIVQADGLGTERLHQDAARGKPAAGAPRHLREQLDASLGRAEVGQVMGPSA